MGHWGKRGRGYAGKCFIYLVKYRLKEDDKIIERVIETTRVSRTVKGGKRASYRSIAVVGNGNGAVGYGMGKAQEAVEAVRKALNNARKNMYIIPLHNGTIPHEVEGRFKTVILKMRPATPGTGVTAGNVIRAICDAAGIKNILTKVIRGGNPMNIVKAFFDGVSKLRTLQFQSELRAKPLKENLLYKK